MLFNDAVVKLMGWQLLYENQLDRRFTKFNTVVTNIFSLHITLFILNTESVNAPMNHL